MSGFYPLTVARVRNETRDTIAVALAVPAGLEDRFRFVQGQHLTLRTRINGEDVRRSYSICSAVQDGELRIAIKRVHGGVFSTWANDTLKPGHCVEVMPPMGHFNAQLDALSRRHYLGFAAGSGITPMLSIIKTTLAAEPHSQFTLVYGNRASSTVIFKEALAELKDTYLGRLNIVHVMSREQQDIDLFNGRLTREKCDRLLTQWIRLADVDIAFVCGPREMMDAVSGALQAHGMPRENIKIELFAASIPKHRHEARARPLAGRKDCEVMIILDGSQHCFSMEKDTESVLDAGLKHGIDMRYSCKGGVCATCRGKVIEGKADMDTNFALEDYEVARGFVLTCQSFPITDRIRIDFDQDT